MPFQFSAALWTARQNRAGEQIRVWRKEDCSCLNPLTRQWNRSHSTCGGTGKVLTELSVSGYKAIVSNAGDKMESDTAGRILSNDLILETFPDQILLSRGDEVALVYSTRKTEMTETLRRGVDEKSFYPMMEVFQVRQGGTLYAEGDDYSYSEGAPSLTWAAGHGPASGSSYSIRYDGQIVYSVYETRRRGSTAVTQAAFARVKEPAEQTAGVAG